MRREVLGHRGLSGVGSSGSVGGGFSGCREACRGLGVVGMLQCRGVGLSGLSVLSGFSQRQGRGVDVLAGVTDKGRRWCPYGLSLPVRRSLFLAVRWAVKGTKRKGECKEDRLKVIILNISAFVGL